jgi:hypothetical protein
MKRTFQFEYDDDSPRGISYEVPESAYLRTSNENGTLFLFANQASLLELAILLVKLGTGDYKTGFHLHLRKGFGDDASQPDVLTVLLAKDTTD